jgi:geranylgeranyl reductase family protein
MSHSPEVVVVGGGPSGAAAAYWLAEAGHSVAIIEKKEYPREKTCGDGLTPRSIYELQEMGFDFEVPELHRINGLRSYGAGSMIEMEWPDHPWYPNWGAIIRRADLDEQVARLAEKQGAVIHQKATAAPVIEDGRLKGVEVSRGHDSEVLSPRVVVVADGAVSRFGRQLGVGRDRKAPYGLALRAYYSSPRADDDMMESLLDLKDKEGNNVPGYGWTFPLGGETVNIGVGLLSTSKRWKGLNTGQLLDTYLENLPEHWEVTEDSRLTEPVGGKLSMAFSGGPVVGSNWVLVGDALGSTNPFTGEGIAYGYQTGRMAAATVHRALEADDLSVLRRYPEELEAEFGDYYRVGKVFVRAIGNPHIMRAFMTVGFKSRPLMEWTFRVMSNLMPPDQRSLTRQLYGAIESAVRLAPAGLGTDN